MRGEKWGRGGKPTLLTGVTYRERPETRTEPESLTAAVTIQCFNHYTTERYQEAFTPQRRLLCHLLQSDSSQL